MVRGVASAKASRGMFLEARLVRLGKYTFIDFTPPHDLESLELHDLVFPYIRSHMIGRMQKTANSLRIDFFDSEWVDKESKTGRLSISKLRTELFCQLRPRNCRSLRWNVAKTIRPSHLRNI
jgi:hypothetical protein